MVSLRTVQLTAHAAVQDVNDLRGMAFSGGTERLQETYRCVLHHLDALDGVVADLKPQLDRVGAMYEETEQVPFGTGRIRQLLESGVRASEAGNGSAAHTAFTTAERNLDYRLGEFLPDVEQALEYLQ